MQGFVPLLKMNSNTGTFCLIPTSNVKGVYPQIDSLEHNKVLELDFNIGDFLMFDSRIHHSTSVNSAIEQPWTLLFTYRSWWVKPGFDYWRYFSNNQSCISSLNPLDRVILGQSSAIPFDPRESVSSRRPII